MKRTDDFNRQWRSVFPTLVLIGGLSLLLMAPVLVMYFWKGVPIDSMTRDPVTVMGGEIYMGYLSQLGIFFWAASITVCFFAAAILADRPELAALRPFFIASGLFSMLLGLDDVFLLHEDVFPILGVPEKLVYVSYMAIASVWLLRFRTLILNSDYLLLGVALCFFGASVGLDAVGLYLKGHFLVEDGAKLSGIICWLTYFSSTAMGAIRDPEPNRA